MGLGLGGFIDGIALHQILQWHHMLTGEHGGEPMTTLAGLEANTVADGFFHLTTWILVAVAVRMLHHNWRSGRFVPPWRAQLGLMLTGWGTFNVVEGLIDHHLLGIHHVRDDLGGPVGWDVAFLALGAILIVGGLAMARRANREAAAVARPPSS
jgi:uncharacterized membrane protein